MCILYSSVRTVMDLITLADFLFLLLSHGFPVRHSFLFLGISQHALKLQGCWKEALQNVTYDPKFKKLRCTFCF